MPVPPTLHLAHQAGSGGYAFDECYFTGGDQLFRIMILHTDGHEDWALYNRFLQSFTFP